MNAFTLMKKDHKRVKDLFRKIVRAKDTAEREVYFTEIKKELDAHAYMEENVFYPALKKEKPTRDLILESYEEHHVVKLLLAELDELPKCQEEWSAKLKVLRENVEHHIQEEEGDIFPKAKKILGDQAEPVGEEMQKTKEYFLDNL